jgi:hypothetical protein
MATQFLAGELRRLAERPGLDEVLDRIDRRQGGGRVGLSQAVDARSPVAVTTPRGPLLLRTDLIAVWYQPGDLPVP